MRHALLNAIGPIVNVIALNLAWLVGGVVIVEQIFAYPGLAKLMIDAGVGQRSSFGAGLCDDFLRKLCCPDFHCRHGVDSL